MRTPTVAPAIAEATRVAAVMNRVTQAAAMTDVTLTFVSVGVGFVTVQGTGPDGTNLTYDQGARFLSDGLHATWTDGVAYQSSVDGQWLRTLTAALDGYSLKVTVTAQAPTGGAQ